MAGNAAIAWERKEIKMKVRFDYPGNARGKRLLFNAKDTLKFALENRDRNIALLKNYPVQGVQIEQLNTDFETYCLYDEQEESWITYAPVEVVLKASSLEDTLRFILREELRKIEVLEPEEMRLDGYNIERFLVRLHHEMKDAIHAAMKQQERK